MAAARHRCGAHHIDARLARPLTQRDSALIGQTAYSGHMGDPLPSQVRKAYAGEGVYVMGERDRFIAWVARGRQSADRCRRLRDGAS